MAREATRRKAAFNSKTLRNHINPGVLWYYWWEEECREKQRSGIIRSDNLEVEGNSMSVGKQLVARFRSLSHPSIRRDFLFPRVQSEVPEEILTGSGGSHVSP